MPAINVTIEVGGPIVSAIVHVSLPRALAMKTAGLPPIKPVIGQFLLDTGASSTCVDPELIKSLNLPQVGLVGIATPSTNGQWHHCPQYDCSIRIPASGNDLPLLVPALPIITTHLRSQGIDGLYLVGM